MSGFGRAKVSLITAIALCVAGCGDIEEGGSDDRSPAGDFDGDPQGGGAPGGGGGANGDSSEDSEGDGGLAAEIEETLSFELPQAGVRSVYVPNPITSRVAVVDAKTFAIETVRAGDEPTYAATVPGRDLAIVLNVGSRDATLLVTQDGKTKTQALAIGHDANAIAVAPGGDHAVVYFDPRDPSRTAQSFQDVTVIDLSASPVTSRGVSVGFRPRAVQFSEAGRQAFVITEDGISIIALDGVAAGSALARLVSVGDTLKDDALSTDIAITPNGRWAITRKPGGAVLRLVDLESGEITSLDLATLTAPGDAGAPLGAGPLDITDLDLAPDGQSAIAVARSHGALIEIPVPSGFTTTSALEVTQIDDQRIGSVTIAPTGRLAIAYTTAAPEEGVVLVDLVGGAAPRGVRLRKSVRAVGFSADGSRAFILHDKTQGPLGPGVDEEQRIDRSEGYSLLDTTTGFAKLQLTAARISEQGIVVTPDARRMFALQRDDSSGVRAAQIVDLSSFQVQTIELVAPPSSIGLVPAAERVFLGQELSGGMISFFDWNSGELVKAVTGFELTSRIRQ